jgi:HEAT repeat protein
MDVWSRYRRTLQFACVLAALAPLAGCADGPFNGGGTWNPWLRKEWEKDERRGPTFHTQMKQLQELAESAPSLPVARQDQLSQEMLERYHNEANPLLRSAIVRVAGGLRGTGVDETLSAAIKDSDTEVRVVAAQALGRRGNEEALQLLASAMSSETELDVRIAVADELKRFKNSPEATRALAVALDDNDAALQHQAIKSLEVVTGRSYGMSVPAWREHLAGGDPAPVPGPSLVDRAKGWVWW